MEPSLSTAKPCPGPVMIATNTIANARQVMMMLVSALVPSTTDPTAGCQWLAIMITAPTIESMGLCE